LYYRHGKNYQGPNPRGRFLGDLVSCDDLYDHYCKWCNAKSLTQIGKDEFTRELEAMGFTKNKLEALSMKKGEENIYAYIIKWITLSEERIGLGRVSLNEYHPVNWFPK